MKVVSRSVARLDKCRRLWKNVERKLNTHLQFIAKAVVIGAAQTSPRDSYPRDPCRESPSRLALRQGSLGLCNEGSEICDAVKAHRYVLVARDGEGPRDAGDCRIRNGRSLMF